uniref:Uncharacterized protein n=1 Tax=Romanomermis culicivorax TaxID=13658 RepID=A0A915KD30_ROMCU
MNCKFSSKFYAVDSKSDYKSGSLIYISPVVSSIFFAANVIAVIFLFLAVCKQVPKYLKPMLVVLALSALFSGLTVLILILGLTMDSEYLIEFLRIRLRTKGADPQKIPSKKELTGAAILAIFVCLFSMLIQIWWYNVVKACHVYLQEKSVWHSYRPSIGQSVTYGGADVSSRPLVQNFHSGRSPQQQQPQTTVAPQQPWHAVGGGQNPDVAGTYSHPPPPYSEVVKQDVV